MKITPDKCFQFWFISQHRLLLFTTMEHCSTIPLLLFREILSDVHFHVHDNPTQWSWRKKRCLPSSQCFGYLILLDLDFFFFFLLFFWFSYGDYSFGRALKTTVGRGEGEAAGLKDRIKQGGGVKQCIKDGETERRRCWVAQETFPFSVAFSSFHGWRSG